MRLSFGAASSGWEGRCALRGAFREGMARGEALGWRGVARVARGGVARGVAQGVAPARAR